ncbi:MAG: SsrA-binding protein SmpB [Candidatus Colwellbacteria bacterium]|nr:SsrA-binding protein SmpB [Candidatus Colwellbacteria bacterium]
MSVFATNRRADFDYEFSETLEAGVELTGFEAKAVRKGLINLSGSYALLRGGELWLINAAIAPYQPNNAPPDFVTDRARRLLVRRDELKTLHGKLNEKGLTLVPKSVYSKNGFIKVSVGLGRKRKKYDKREVAHERDAKREIDQTLKKQ